MLEARRLDPSALGGKWKDFLVNFHFLPLTILNINVVKEGETTVVQATGSIE